MDNIVMPERMNEEDFSKLFEAFKTSRREEALRWKGIRQGSLESLFKDQGSLQDLVELATSFNFITGFSFSHGIIPLECSICGEPLGGPRNLVFHHWLGSYKWALDNSYYRRICSSCNSLLGRLFKGIYPPRWEDQFAELSRYMGNRRKVYANFKGKEGWWSLITPREVREVRKLVILFYMGVDSLSMLNSRMKALRGEVRHLEGEVKEVGLRLEKASGELSSLNYARKLLWVGRGKGS